ncbi:hypothetical protein [Gordonia paraffinivorans]|uniref:hypothetical protein n=1 Tax=Gordonia paraffinivorans TaxID=175628 RepID=UPI0014453E38|nr:hypothetical protein [Gordonia paraffinivorans]
MKKIATRIAAGTIGALGVAGVAFGAACAAHAGTMPIVRPGEPTVTMTISNHTDKPEYLVGSSAAGGEWVNGPAQVLYPGATEIVSAAAPLSGHLDVGATYRIGLGGPTAEYQISNLRYGVDTSMTGVSGRGSQQYWINTSVATGYPQANVSYDLW